MRGLILAALALLAAPATAQDGAPTPFAPPPAEKRVVYRHASLFDGTGAPVRPDMAIVVEGETIRAVLPDAELKPEHRQGVEEVDLTGRYLIPGLIDSHEHLATPPDREWAEAMMQRDLLSGITAVRDMADDTRSVADLARAARIGEIAGPDLYFAALMAGPSFFDDPRTKAAAMGAEPGKVPWMQAIDDATDLPLAVAMARGTGATAIKIYANLPPHLVKAIAAEARRQGFRSWAHGMVFPTPPADVIAARLDVISHTCYLAYQAMDQRPASYQQRSLVDPAVVERRKEDILALFRAMKAQGILLDPTLRVFAEADKRHAADPKSKPPYCTLDLAARLTRWAIAEGLQVSAGTDGFTDRDDPWPALHEELKLLVEHAGLTPAAALRAATLVGARTLGEEERMGTIEAGKLANMVVLAKDPTADIGNIRSTVLTVKRGRRHDRPQAN